MKTNILSSIVLALVLITSSAAADLVSERAKFRPYKQDFPQVIQAGDYETIQFIELMYTTIRELGTGKINCMVGKTNVTFSSVKMFRGQAILMVPEIGNVQFNGQVVTNADTVQLCRKLLKMLSNLSKVRPCNGVALNQFSTRAYKQRTIIEFNFSDRVVAIDCLSNGPNDNERLYTLDLVEPSESFFFSAPATGDDR